MKLKNSNHEKTRKLKLREEKEILTKLEKSNCDQTLKIKLCHNLRVKICTTQKLIL